MALYVFSWSVTSFMDAIYASEAANATSPQRRASQIFFDHWSLQTDFKLTYLLNSNFKIWKAVTKTGVALPRCFLKQFVEIPLGINVKWKQNKTEKWKNTFKEWYLLNLRSCPSRSNSRLRCMSCYQPFRVCSVFWILDLYLPPWRKPTLQWRENYWFLIEATVEQSCFIPTC